MKEISANLSNLNGVGGVASNATPSLNTPQGKADAALFRETLQRVPGSISRGDAAQAPAPASALKFSNHAVDRMQARGVRFSPEQMGKIQSAVSKAAEKGAKNCLLLSDEAALIVSVKDKTVVTVMDKTNLKENVFTNIDSTVMI